MAPKYTPEEIQRAKAAEITDPAEIEAELRRLAETGDSDPAGEQAPAAPIPMTIGGAEQNLQAALCGWPTLKGWKYSANDQAVALVLLSGATPSGEGINKGGHAWAVDAMGDSTVTRLLHHCDGSFYLWNGSIYRRAHYDEIRSQVVQWDIKPATFTALKLITRLESDLAPPFNIDGTQFDSEGLIFFANGILDVRDMKFQVPDPTIFNVNALPVRYVEAGKVPTPERWLRFLNELWPGDPECPELLQQWFGYSLVRTARYDKIMFMVGPPRSGKGCTERVLTAMLGDHNVAHPLLSTFGNQFNMEGLVGKHHAIFGDAQFTREAPVVVERLLNISGSGDVTVERKKKTDVTLHRGLLRLTMISNTIPYLRHPTLATRFVVLPFDQSFLGREDPGLTNKLLAELPGIVAWAIQGYHHLVKQGYFTEPRAGLAAKDRLELQGSHVAAFVRQRCELGASYCVQTTVLYAAYVDFCRAKGIVPENAQGFGRELVIQVVGLKNTPRLCMGIRRPCYTRIKLASVRGSKG